MPSVKYKHLVVEEETVREFNKLKKMFDNLTTTDIVEDMIKLEKRELGKRQLYLWTFPLPPSSKRRSR